MSRRAVGDKSGDAAVSAPLVRDGDASDASSDSSDSAPRPRWTTRQQQRAVVLVICGTLLLLLVVAFSHLIFRTSLREQSRRGTIVGKTSSQDPVSDVNTLVSTKVVHDIPGLPISAIRGLLFRYNENGTLSDIPYERRLNDSNVVIVFGTTKGGTTTLYRILKNHPDVLSPHKGRRVFKETHFFDNCAAYIPFDAKNWTEASVLSSKLLAENCRVPMFESFFSREVGSRSNPLSALMLDDTPAYMWDPRIPLLVHTVLPHAKLVGLLRNPVTRAHSHYWMNARRGFYDDRNFEQLVQAELDILRGCGMMFTNVNSSRISLVLLPQLMHQYKACYFPKLVEVAVSYNASRNANRTVEQRLNTLGILGKGLYVVHLGFWRHAWNRLDSADALLWIDDANPSNVSLNPPTERMLIGVSEEFFEDPAKVVGQIHKFIGLDGAVNTTNIQGAFSKNTIHEYKPMRASTLATLSQFYRPYNQLLRQFLTMYRVRSREDTWEQDLRQLWDTY